MSGGGEISNREVCRLPESEQNKAEGDIAKRNSEKGIDRTKMMMMMMMFDDDV